MHCTKCGAVVSADTLFCGNCGAPVASKSTIGARPYSAAGAHLDPEAKARQEKEQAAGCVGLLIFAAVAFFGIRSCTSETPEEKAAAAQEVAAAEAKSAADKNQGFHCLSAWDGSSAQLEVLVKASLRDPDSFEHEETRITPVKDGKHAIMMRYRAKNGFGGYNKGVALGSIDHESCDATLIANE